MFEHLMQTFQLNMAIKSS